MNGFNLIAKEKYEGSIRHTHWGNVIVTKYVNKENIYIKFLDTGYETKTCATRLRSGQIKDWLKPSVYGFGIVGSELEPYESTTKVFKTWSNMIKRCHSKNWKRSKMTYDDCTVSANFQYYPYFKEWYFKQIGHDQESWDLDKDILVKGNKVYSEDTCCFVPMEINTLFISAKKLRGELPKGVTKSKNGKKYIAQVNGNAQRQYLGQYGTPEEAFYAYKAAKEKRIKEVANKWKDQIDPRVYDALMKYQVEIID